MSEMEFGAAYIQFAWPPSTNRWLRVYGGRAVKSKEWKAWQEGAGMALHEQYKGPIYPKDGVSVVIVLNPPNKRRFDIDNRAKPILDALEGHIINDDSQIDSLHIMRGMVLAGGNALVRVMF